MMDTFTKAELLQMVEQQEKHHLDLSRSYAHSILIHARQFSQRECAHLCVSHAHKAEAFTELRNLITNGHVFPPKKEAGQ